MEREDLDNTQEPVPLYAICSHCGQQLGQYYPPCRKVMLTCTRCGAKIAIAAKESKIIIDVIATKHRPQNGVAS